jgi:hypothetical protein
MIVTDFDGEASVRSQRELERRLTSSRRGRYGAFVLSHRKDGPSLWVHVNGGACLHYFPDPDYLVHAGYQPTGMTPPGCRRAVRFGAHRGRIEEFGGAYLAVPPDNLVSLPDAVAAAKEFFKADTLPASIRWLEF